MAERGGLENRCTLAGTVGSNPHPLRQFNSSGNSLPRSERQKNSLYQRHLLNWLSTAPAA